MKGFFTFVVWIAAVFNRSWAKLINEQWEGVNWNWALVPIGFVAGYYFLQAIHKKYDETTQAHKAREDELAKKVSDLTAILDEREKVKARLVERNRLIVEANEIVRLILQGTGSLPTIADKANAWMLTATAFVAREYPLQDGLFKSDAGLDKGTARMGNPAWNRLYCFMQNRIVRLGHLG